MILMPKNRELAYFSGQVVPRIARIAKSSRVWITLILGAIAGLASPYLPVGQTPVSSLASAGLAFASVSFAACVTGAVLALTLPSSEFRKFTSKTRNGSSFSAYSQLIFTFTWSAFAQLAVVVTSVLGLIFGGDYLVSPLDSHPINRISLGTATFVFTYAFMQLATVITTISQVAAVMMAIDSQPGPEDRAADAALASRSESKPA